MAAPKIVFDYAAMETAVASIKSIAQEYANAAATFNASMNGAITTWTGASKMKFVTLLTSVNNYMSVSVPQMVDGLADVLDKNSQSMDETDTQIAAKIPDSV